MVDNMNKINYKNLKIKPETHKRLSEFGNKTETYSDLIEKLIDGFEKNKGK